MEEEEVEGWEGVVVVILGNWVVEAANIGVVIRVDPDDGLW